MSHPANDLYLEQRKEAQEETRTMPKPLKERVFTCKETEDLAGVCELCGYGIDRHGSDYECLETSESTNCRICDTKLDREDYPPPCDTCGACQNMRYKCACEKSSSKRKGRA